MQGEEEREEEEEEKDRGGNKREVTGREEFLSDLALRRRAEAMVGCGESFGLFDNGGFLFLCDQ